MTAVLILLNLGAGTKVQAASSIFRVLEGRSVLLPHANQHLPSCIFSYIEELC